MFEFSGFNLLSEDCVASAILYEKIFKFTIINSSRNHSELMISDSNLLYFNKPSENCPVRPGSFTLKIDTLNIEKLQETLTSFNLETFSRKNNYAAFLDEYGNRIWVYES